MIRASSKLSSIEEMTSFLHPKRNILERMLEENCV